MCTCYTVALDDFVVYVCVADWMIAVKVLQCIALAGMGLSTCYVVATNFMMNTVSFNRVLEALTSMSGKDKTTLKRRVGSSDVIFFPVSNYFKTFSVKGMTPSTRCVLQVVCVCVCVCVCV